MHDQCGVLVRLFAEGVQLGNCIVERLLSKVASAVRRVQDLVVEHREVQGKAKTNRVSGGQLGLCNIRCRLVRIVSVRRSLLPLLAGGELGEVTVVVSLPVKVGNLSRSDNRRITFCTLTSCNKTP